MRIQKIRKKILELTERAIRFFQCFRGNILKENPSAK